MTMRHDSHSNDRPDKLSAGDTLSTSQAEQARGYLQSLADDSFIGEFQRALKHARRLTNKHWKVVIRADRIEIRSDPSERPIKIPHPESIGRDRPRDR